MIALLLADRCVQCNACVEVCPGAVFDLSPGAPPRIARPDDCQTCFFCELYCRADAIYVAPQFDRHVVVDEDEARVRATLGAYRRHSGWHEWQDAYPNLQWLMETVFRRAAEAEKPVEPS